MFLKKFLIEGTTLGKKMYDPHFLRLYPHWKLQWVHFCDVSHLRDVSKMETGSAPFNWPSELKKESNFSARFDSIWLCTGGLGGKMTLRGSAIGPHQLASYLMFSPPGSAAKNLSNNKQLQLLSNAGLVCIFVLYLFQRWQVTIIGHCDSVLFCT